MTRRSDIDLMLAVQAGDEGAFRALVDRHRNAIVNLAWRYLGNRTDAEDLAQEVFLKVYRARRRYRPDAKFTTWLYRVAVNASLNEVRNRKNRATFGAVTLGGGDEGARGLDPAGDPANGAPDAALERAELRERVRAAVGELPDRQRMALLLNKFHGLGYQELSDALGLSIPAVKSLLVRARENVRRALEPYVRGEAPADPGHGVAS